MGRIHRGPHYTGLYEVVKEVLIHVREITSLKCIENYIITASLDGRIYILDQNLKKIKEFKTGRVLMAIDYHLNRLVYTTKDGEIAYYEIDILDIKNNKQRNILSFGGNKNTSQGPITVMNSHYSNEECGLVIDDNYTYTSGDDNLLIVTDYIEHKIVGIYEAKPTKKKKPVLLKDNILTMAMKNLIPERVEADHFECDLALNDEFGHLAVTHKEGNIIIKPIDDLDKVRNFTFENIDAI